MIESPDADHFARVIAENVYAAFCRTATMPIPYREEQIALTRIVEAIRPQVGKSSPGELIEAANMALSEWEQRDAEVRGQRVVSISPIDGSVKVA
jgi:hypothetical protein